MSIIKTRAGDTLRATVTFRDPVSRELLDMRGRNVAVVVKKVGYPLIPVNPQFGTMLISVPPSATSTWRPGEMEAFMRVTEPDGTINSTGNFTLDVEAG